MMTGPDLTDLISLAGGAAERSSWPAIPDSREFAPAV